MENTTAHVTDRPRDRSRYILTLEADGRRDDAAEVRKLRALLKRLGRTYGLRAVSIRPEPQTAKGTR